MATVTKSIFLYPRREAPSQTPSVPFSDLYNSMWAPSHFIEEKMEPCRSGDPTHRGRRQKKARTHMCTTGVLGLVL